MKHITRLLALTLCLITLTTSALAYPAGFRVYNGDREQKRIAITVDDIYDADVLRMMHELSLELDFPITWFCLGVNFRDEDKDIWQSIVDNGSEIGSHSWYHHSFTILNKYVARNYVLMTQERIDELLGYHYPLRLLRPPYGNHTTDLLNLFYEYGVEKTVLWDVSSTDPQEAFRTTQNGSILLFHTNYTDYDCLVELIPMLKDAGYELVTVSELLGMDPIEITEEKYVFPYR